LLQEGNKETVAVHCSLVHESDARFAPDAGVGSEFLQNVHENIIVALGGGKMEGGPTVTHECLLVDPSLHDYLDAIVDLAVREDLALNHSAFDALVVLQDHLLKSSFEGVNQELQNLFVPVEGTLVDQRVPVGVDTVVKFDDLVLPQPLEYRLELVVPVVLDAVRHLLGFLCEQLAVLHLLE
jgi:hypothetical protein